MFHTEVAAVRLVSISMCVVLWVPHVLYARDPLAAQSQLPAAAKSGAFVCPTTVPEGDPGGAYGNDALEVYLSVSKFVFAPGGIGFQAVSDGALGVKVGWNRKRKGRFTIDGRRLDGPAPPARASVTEGYGDIGGQSTYVIFPTPGCWEITGHLGGDSFSFVVGVEKIGNGPEGRLDL